MAKITTKIKFGRLAEVIKHMPDNGEFVIDFDTATIHNLAGDKIAEFSKNLFETAHIAEPATLEDFDSALEAIEPSPIRNTDSINYVREKH
jgi:hypothetical protein